MINKPSESRSAIISRSAKTSLVVIIGAILGLALQIMQARVFGAEIVGLISLGFAIVSSLSIFVLFGFDKYLIREVPNCADKSQLVREIIGIMVVPVLLAATCLFIFSGYLAVFFEEPRLGPVIKIFSPFLLIYVSNSISKNLLIGIGNSVRNAFLESLLLRSIKVSLILLSFFFLNRNLSLVLACIYVAAEFTTLLFRVKYLRSQNLLHFRIRGSFFFRPPLMLIKGALPFFVVGGTYFLVTQIDKIFIGKMLNSFDLGIYSVAATLSAMVGLFSSGFIAFWPEISRLFHENKIDELSKMYQEGIETLLILVTPFLAWAVFFTPEILQIFGKDFMAGSSVLAILLLGRSFDVATGPIGAILLMTRYAWIDGLNGILSLLLCVGLNILLIPHLGLIGAAIATGTGIALVNIVKVIEVHSLLGILGYRLRDLWVLSPFIIVFLLTRLVTFKVVYLNMAIVLMLIYPLSFAIFKITDILTPTIKRWGYATLKKII